ncbi:MAG: T9SS type A sorting domain-containing protein [Ignavibacteriales bacterium]|nr:T9SS type A sorting domain-containing protein [Ignavibacteriales bacterium]
MNKIIVTIMVIFSIKLSAQDYPLAPEVWSEPKRVEDIYIKGIDADNPSLTKNLDTMYFYRSGEIYVTTLKEGKWQTPKRLNNNVNAGGAMRNPSISKDGRRIYYAAWGGYGGWDLWYNDWDPLTNDWGSYKNLGPKLNSPTMDWYLYEVSKDTLFILDDKVATPSPILYVFNKTKNDWAIADSFYYHKLGCCSVQGISMPANKKKIYYSDINFSWSNGNYKKRYSELCIVYWDENKNYWSDPYFLNINSEAFQPDPNNPFNWTGGVDEFPWISRNGKTLYFHSSRREAREDSSNAYNIYVSYLLIDENGKPVSVENENKIPTGYKLYQNYPNPFNPSTKIKYSIPETTFISLTLYDIRGRRITELVNEERHPGEYEVELNSNKYNLSSGVYIYQLRTSRAVLTNKLTLIK